MRGAKFSLSTIIAIGLSATLVVGVTAQEEADDAVAAAPVAVTNTNISGGCPDPGTTEDMGRFERTIGGTCQPIWRWSDERLNGTATMVANEDNYTDGSGLSLGTSALTIENAEGGWRQRPSFWVAFPDAPDAVGEAMVMDGEGAYDGLTAVLVFVSEDFTAHGFIIEGDMPPAPENASAM